MAAQKQQLTRLFFDLYKFLIAVFLFLIVRIYLLQGELTPLGSIVFFTIGLSSFLIAIARHVILFRYNYEVKGIKEDARLIAISLVGILLIELLGFY